ncbi:MAG: VOC family protein [Candidatus Latescibacterota bacterium]|nr:VOC family protein [Candidatus Latescibacterota bacterium]
MPNYALNHIHHETKDVDAAVAWYKKLFGASSDPPFERGGATWVFVHIGAIQITVTDREFTDMELGRYQGYDHFALTTDDFDQTLAEIEEHGVEIWMGPVALENGSRIVFINGPDNVKIELMEQD